MRSQLRLSEFAELHTLMTDPPTEPTTALGVAPGTRAGSGPMQTPGEPSGREKRQRLTRRKGARHPKPARLPRPEEASRYAIVRTFSTTAACFGPFCHLVYRQRLPPRPGMASKISSRHLLETCPVTLCAVPSLGEPGSPSARPSRAPCSHTRPPRRSGHRPCPAIHVTGHVWPPSALARNHRLVREPGPLLPLS